MKNKCVKLASIVMLLAFVLTGCSLIEIDPVMQLEEDIAAVKEENATALATYEGGEITYADVAYQFSNEYGYISYMYSMYGYPMTPEDMNMILEDVVASHMDTRAMLLHADEMGISLTEEEKAECLTAAEEAYQEAYDTVYSSVEGETEELKKLQAEHDMIANGATMEVFVNQQEWTLILEKMQEALGADITELEEDDLEMRLVEQAIADEETYANDLAAYESDMMDEEICITWNPNGYRTVKHVLVMADETLVSDAAALHTDLIDAEETLGDLESELRKANAAETDDDSHRAAEDIQADIDATTFEIETLTSEIEAADAAVIASVQDKIDEIYAALEEGQDFDSVMAEFGEDPGMQAEPAMSRGYYVCADSPTWDYNFRDAAMALENVGDYSSEPVVSSSGVHIIYYNSDVIGGQRPMDEIRDEFYPMALEAAKEDHMADVVAGWVNELDPEYNVDGFFTAE